MDYYIIVNLKIMKKDLLLSSLIRKYLSLINPFSLNLNLTYISNENQSTIPEINITNSPFQIESILTLILLTRTRNKFPLTNRSVTTFLPANSNEINPPPEKTKYHHDNASYPDRNFALHIIRLPVQTLSPQFQ